MKEQGQLLKKKTKASLTLSAPHDAEARGKRKNSNTGLTQGGTAFPILAVQKSTGQEDPPPLFKAGTIE